MVWFMKTQIRNRRWGILLQFLLVYSWLANLVGTNSFYSVYVLCALAGIYLMLRDDSQNDKLSRREKEWILLFSSLFSIAVMMENYANFTPLESFHTQLKIVCSFLGGLLIAWNILAYLLAGRLSAGETEEDPRKGREWGVFTCVFLTIAGIDLLYLFFAAYPGVLSADSFSAIEQILSGSYNNTTPYWHTMTVRLFLETGMALFGDLNAAIACFCCGQIFFLVACMAYAVMTLYQAGIPKPVLAVIYAIYAFVPYNIVYSVTLWKDVLFGAAALLLCTALFRILRKIGKMPIWNYGVFAFGATGFCLWRTNGWYAFFAVVLVILLFQGKHCKKLLLVMLAVLVLCWILINPFLMWMDVPETDSVEAFAVPFQQIARYVAEDGWMDEYEREFLAVAFDLEKVREVYEPYCVDPVKFQAFRKENLDYIKENLIGYGKLYLQFLIRSPQTYFEAWVDETKGFWGAGFPDAVYDLGVAENSLGITQTGGGNLVAELYESYFNTVRWTATFQPLFAIGLHVWAIIGCCLTNVLRRRREFLLSVPLIVLAVGLWFGTPVVAEFRYGYPMMLTAPLIMAVTRYEKPDILQ